MHQIYNQVNKYLCHLMKLLDLAKRDGKTVLISIIK